METQVKKNKYDRIFEKFEDLKIELQDLKLKSEKATGKQANKLIHQYETEISKFAKLTDENDQLRKDILQKEIVIEKLRTQIELREEQHNDEINQILTSFNADLKVLQQLNSINAKDYTHRQKRLLNDVFSDTVTEMFRISKNPKDDLPF